MPQRSPVQNESISRQTYRSVIPVQEILQAAKRCFGIDMATPGGKEGSKMLVWEKLQKDRVSFACETLLITTPRSPFSPLLAR